jgi:hypothetical protein
MLPNFNNEIPERPDLSDPTILADVTAEVQKLPDDLFVALGDEFNMNGVLAALMGAEEVIKDIEIVMGIFCNELDNRPHLKA